MLVWPHWGQEMVRERLKITILTFDLTSPLLCPTWGWSSRDRPYRKCGDKAGSGKNISWLWLPPVPMMEVPYPWFVVDLVAQLAGQETLLDVFSRQTKGAPTTVRLCCIWRPQTGFHHPTPGPSMSLLESEILTAHWSCSSDSSDNSIFWSIIQDNSTDSESHCVG